MASAACSSGRPSSSRYPEEPEGLLSLDPQLVCYSWITGIAEVAQVVFVRKSLVEVQYLRTTISDEQRQEFGRLVEGTIRRIESARLPAAQWHPLSPESVQQLSVCGPLSWKAGNDRRRCRAASRSRRVLIGLTSLITEYPPMPPKFNRRRAVFVLGKIDEILAWEQRKETERDTKFVELGRYLCEVRAGQYWRLEKFEVFRRISGKAVSGIEEEGVLPDVDPRAPATAGEEGTEGSGMGEGHRAGQAGEEGRAEVRLCNLVAQSPGDAEERNSSKEVERELTGREDGTLGDCLLQTVPEPNAGHREGDRDGGSDAGKSIDREATAWR